jgi:tRNA A37 threonylcarbamoyladenosine dehydratase
MPYPFALTEILVGQEGLAKLQTKHVLIAGLGGVGSYAAEAMARAGVGRLTLLDHDVVSPSNINRQLPALHSTIGQAMTSVLAQRLKDINPSLQLKLLTQFLQPSQADAFITAGGYDSVLDCIDSIACKAACGRLHGSRYSDSFSHGGGQLLGCDARAGIAPGQNPWLSSRPRVTRPAESLGSDAKIPGGLL